MVETQQFLKVILYEGEGALALTGSERLSSLQSLLEQGYEVSVTQDQEISGIEKGFSYLILGKFQNDHPQKIQQSDYDATFYFKNLDDINQDELPNAVDQIREEVHLTKAGNWKPWFPVIDVDRCTNCLQCLSFCLFDVYGTDANKVIEVQNPTKCKTDCPACSRVCPEAAIIFPKYKHGPINGDVVNDHDLEREKMKVDISSLLGGDIYGLLRDRREQAKSRFSKERDDDRALKERKRCLAKLKKDLDIPDEVLMSLPNLEQIQSKASQTKNPNEN